MNYRQRLERRIPQVESLIAEKRLAESIATSERLLSEKKTEFSSMSASLSTRFPDPSDQLEHALEETLVLSKLSLLISGLKNDVDIATLEHANLERHLTGLKRDMAFYLESDIPPVVHDLDVDASEVTQ